jgi:Tfp pilus assembly protein PilO
MFLISKYYVVIVVLLVLFTLAAGYFFIIKDRVVKIQEVELVDLQSAIDALSGREDTLFELKQLHEKYSRITEDQILQLSYVLPQQSEIPYLVIEIKNFIKENDLLLNSIDVGSLKSSPISAEATASDNFSVKELKISLSINGVDSYFKLKDFLDNLSTNLPLLELTSLVYSPGIDAYSLNLTTYYQ